MAEDGSIGSGKELRKSKVDSPGDQNPEFEHLGRETPSPEKRKKETVGLLSSFATLDAGTHCRIQQSLLQNFSFFLHPGPTVVRSPTIRSSPNRSGSCACKRSRQILNDICLHDAHLQRLVLRDSHSKLSDKASALLWMPPSAVKTSGSYLIPRSKQRRAVS